MRKRLRGCVCALVAWLALVVSARAQPVGQPQFITVIDSGTACVTAPAACAIFSLDNQTASISLSISGTWTGTLTFEGTNNGGIWTPVSATNRELTTSVTSTTGSGLFSISNAGLVKVRVRATAAVTGSALVTAAKGFGSSGNNAGGSGSAGGWTDSGALVSLTTGTDLIGSNLRPTDASYTLGDITHRWNNAFFASGGGLSFSGVASPITMVGGDDGFGDTALIINNATDDYVVLSFPASATDFYTDGPLSIIAPNNNYITVDGTAGTTIGGNVLIQGGGLVLGGSFTGGDITTNGILHMDALPITSITAGFNRRVGTSVQWATTGGVAADNYAAFYTNPIFGYGGVASKGTMGGYFVDATVEGSGDANNESVAYFGGLSMDIGAGFTQTTGPTGNMWGSDLGVHGPIGVQPGLLGGISQVVNNYYNGSPSQASSMALAALTYPQIGAGLNATHSAATTYPVDVGIIVSGRSGVPGVAAGIGFTTGIRVGGAGANWLIPSSLIGTGIDISQFATAGINIHAQTDTTKPDINITGFMQFANMTDPAAPADNIVVLFADTSAGKDRLCARFHTGAVQCFATEP